MSVADNAVAAIANDLRLVIMVVVTTVVVIVGQDDMVVIGAVDFVAIVVRGHVDW